MSRKRYQSPKGPAERTVASPDIKGALETLAPYLKDMELVEKGGSREERASEWQQAIQIKGWGKAANAIIIGAISSMITLTAIKIYEPMESFLERKANPVAEKIVAATSAPIKNELAPLKRNTSPWGELAAYGPACAIDCAMKQILKSPPGFEIKPILDEAISARTSPEKTREFLEKNGFPLPTQPGKPSLPAHWEAPFKEFLAKEQNGEIPGEALVPLFQKTSLKDRATEQANRIASATKETDPKEIAEIEETLNAQTQKDWSRVNTGIPKEFIEKITTAVQHTKQGKPVAWELKTNSLIAEATVPRTTSLQEPENIGKPTSKVVILGENHELARNYREVIDTMHKKGFRSLSIEMGTGHDLTKGTWAETGAYAKSKGWKVKNNDIPGEEKEATAEKTNTLERWTQYAPNQRIREGIHEKISEIDDISHRSNQIAANLAKSKEPTLHIGGKAHNSQIQDAYANLTGLRPLAVEIKYESEPADLLPENGRAEKSRNSISCTETELGKKLSDFVEARKEKQDQQLVGP